jgi:hypothetical protein
MNLAWNLAGAGLGAAVAVAVCTALIATVAPARVRPTVSGVGTALTGAAGVAAGIAAMAGQSVSVTWPGVLALSGVSWALDPLGGLFTRTAA